MDVRKLVPQEVLIKTVLYIRAEPYVDILPRAVECSVLKT